MFGDGREERMAAFDLEMRLRRNPQVKARHAAYLERVRQARAEADGLTDTEVINALIKHNPAYIRSLLETEDQRFGKGALRDRYAMTFQRKFKAALALKK